MEFAAGNKKGIWHFLTEFNVTPELLKNLEH